MKKHTNTRTDTVDRITITISTASSIYLAKGTLLYEEQNYDIKSIHN